MELRLVTPPTEGPIALDEAKAHLRVDGDAEDFTIDTLLAAAVQHVETVTHRALMPQEWSVIHSVPWAAHRCRSAPLGLPNPPLRAVTRVESLDAAGLATEMPVDTFRVLMPSGPTAGAASIVPLSGWAWPDTGIRITYQAGYAGADAVPRALKAAILLVLGDLFENREGGSQGRAYVVNPTVERLLRPFVVLWP
ncbi:head-tail connector protein [Roseomonas xinghualingensis]|uniref:head-tail connector protein n=1 Tax=Roseomonas xinghualingensis TaxID=2986475 RepID=UPI0021F22E72|nr:head-tail connector protein [Roseomonas sp. SXEYE001]MCV4209986.1 head-tail connector protein [Roseomonas sp. SXEYE001]